MEAYYYGRLDKYGQSVYHAMECGLRRLDSEFQLPRCDAAQLRDIFMKLRLDHPEIFWAPGFRYKFYPDSPNLIFCPEYLFRPDRIVQHQQAMNARVRKLVLPARDLSELEKERYVHDFICESVTYDKLKKAYSHEIIGPLGQGTGVCEGIAKSVKILLDGLGVWNMIALCGNNPEKGIRYQHTWNLVRIGGAYCHLDATFDNTLTLSCRELAGGKAPGRKGKAATPVRYDYFNLSDRQIFRDHEPLLLPAPACPDEGRFYYREKKLSFTTEEEVIRRAQQAARKGSLLTFHWRGGPLTRTVLERLLELLHRAGQEKDRTAAVSVNRPQAVLTVAYRDAQGADTVTMEEANISEKYDGPGEEA